MRCFSPTFLHWFILLWAAWGLVGCGPAPESGGEPAVAAADGALHVEDAWARPGFAGGNSAIYLTVRNGTNSADRLVGVKTEVARAAEIHESEMKDNVMHMHPLAGVALPGDGQVEFSPGGMHVMLVDLEQDLAAGDLISVTLTFDHAEPLEIEVPVLANGAGQLSEQDFHGLLYDPIEPAPGFELVDQNEQPISLSDLRGKLVLLYFGFTNCPDACPLTLSTWNQVHKALGTDAEKVRFVFVTVDPERDTPEVIGKHLALFNEEFVGLWGPLDEIEDIARSYNVFLQKVEIESAMGYLVNHATLTFVIDPQGRLVLAHTLDTPSEEIVADIQTLLP
jgi:protein SCO1/2